MPKKQTEDVTEATTDAPVTVEIVVESEPAEVAYYYLSDKNPNGAFLPGVPLCDLHTAQVEQYPKWIQKSIKASPMYKAANASDEDEGEGGDK